MLQSNTRQPASGGLVVVASGLCAIHAIPVLDFGLVHSGSWPFLDSDSMNGTIGDSNWRNLYIATL